MAALLQVQDLSVSFRLPEGELQAVRGVSFAVQPGEILAIVGESGCGKSTLCKSIMHLLPRTGGIRGGSVLAGGQDITHATERQLQRLRGSFFAMVLQDSLSALDPTLRVGRQVAAAVRLHAPGLGRAGAQRQALALLQQVGIPDPAARAQQYPSQLSGGMRQRVALAIALAGSPRLLFADEPTTALDVTVQQQILALLRRLQRTQHTAAVLVTHDLGVVARAADRVAVMYAGRIVEIGTAQEIFYDPRHPYTWALLQALPAWAQKGQPLYAIPGAPPSLLAPPPGDAFACRNRYALEIDYHQPPPFFAVSETHLAATWLLDGRAPHIPCPLQPGNARPASGR